MSSRAFTRLVQAHHRERWLAARITRWQRRVLFVLGGLLVGGAAVLLAVSADWAQRQFMQVVQLRWWLPLLVTPAGFCLCAYVASRWFANAGGSGIPQAIAAYRTGDETFRHQVLGLRIAFGKMLLTVSGLLFGASTGREGPTVQVGAAIMLAVGKLTPRKKHGLVVAGAAAGVAAAFNTPLAGLMFGIEEMSRSFERHTSGLIIVCVVAAGFMSLGLLGNYTYFGTTGGSITGLSGWLMVPVMGMAGGLLGGWFSRLVIAASRGAWRLLTWRQTIRGTLGIAAVCGLVVALCGVLSNGAVHGTGYMQVKAALSSATALPDGFVLLKYVSTLASAISGIPGGIFAPSLAIGAGLGSDVAQWFAALPLGVMMLLGMVAYLAGVVQAPITSFVIVMEMTDNHALLMPLMATALVASAMSRLVCRESIYHALAHDLLERRAMSSGKP